MTLKILTMTAALTLAASAASAQGATWLSSGASYSDADYRASYIDARRAAYDNGYRDGLKRGAQALRDRKPFDVERERDYRSAEGGYNKAFGDRTRYQNDYRGGFSQGYRDGYNGRDSRIAIGGNRGYGDAGFGAFQNGIADGYRKALEDSEDRKFPDATRHKWYRSGDHDYDNAYGSKDSYRIEYRRGFQEGYNRAFREGRPY